MRPRGDSCWSPHHSGASRQGPVICGAHCPRGPVLTPTWPQSWRSRSRHAAGIGPSGRPRTPRRWPLRPPPHPRPTAVSSCTTSSSRCRRRPRRRRRLLAARPPQQPPTHLTLAVSAPTVHAASTDRPPICPKHTARVATLPFTTFHCFSPPFIVVLPPWAAPPVAGWRPGRSGGGARGASGD